MKHEELLPAHELAPYVGQWVVISENRVIAHSANLTELDEQIRKCKPVPVIAKIPKNEVLIF